MSWDVKTEAVINTIRGKWLVKKASQEDVEILLKQLDAYEALLDEADEGDVFGTEGWRHQLGID